MPRGAISGASYSRPPQLQRTYATGGSGGAGAEEPAAGGAPDSLLQVSAQLPQALRLLSASLSLLASPDAVQKECRCPLPGTPEGSWMILRR